MDLNTTEQRPSDSQRVDPHANELVDLVDTHQDAADLEHGALLVRRPLEAVLDAHGFGSGPLEATAIGEGHSNATFLIRREGFECVLRRPPRAAYEKRNIELLREARIQAALASGPVPVPTVHLIHDDPETIGAPFYLMRYLRGHVVNDVLPEPLRGANTRRSMVESLVDSLVALHHVDVSTVGLTDIDRGAPYLDRMFRTSDRLWAANRARDVPRFDQVRRWLLDHQPTSSGRGLIHGDYRLGNVMYRDDTSGRLEAILDWESCTVGDPLVDLGYLLSCYAVPGDAPGPLRDLGMVLREPGFPNRHEVAVRYAAQTDVDLDRVAWYVAFAYWRTAVGLEGFYKRSLLHKTDDSFIHGLAEGVPRLIECAVEVIDTGDVL